jgi:transposase
VDAAEARASQAESEAKLRALEIERLKLALARLRDNRFGRSAERGRQLAEQLEFQLAELEETETVLAMTAEIAGTPTPSRPTASRLPARRPLPEHLPRETVRHPAPCACPACGGSDLRRLGEEVTETLECEPRRWKVLRHEREKLSCRACEAIAQAPAPSHPIRRGRAGPHLLAIVLAGMYGQHLPLHRQSAAYAREGVALDVSTLSDWVGAATATLTPMVAAIRAHVFAAGRLHADDTTVPVLAKGRTVTGRLWTYVPDDRPFAGPDPPAAVFAYSRDRTGAHPDRHLDGWTGVMQADAYAGFLRLYVPPVGRGRCGRRRTGHIRAGASSIWPSSAVRRPIALEAVTRIDRLFAAERDLNGVGRPKSAGPNGRASAAR